MYSLKARWINKRPCGEARGRKSFGQPCQTAASTIAPTVLDKVGKHGPKGPGDSASPPLERHDTVRRSASIGHADLR